MFYVCIDMFCVCLPRVYLPRCYDVSRNVSLFFLKKTSAESVFYLATLLAPVDQATLLAKLSALVAGGVTNPA